MKNFIEISDEEDIYLVNLNSIIYVRQNSKEEHPYILINNRENMKYIICSNLSYEEVLDKIQKAEE